MLELLPGTAAVVLEDADILEAPVTLQVLNALRRQQQELADFWSLAFQRCPSWRGFSISTSCAPTGTHAIINAVRPAQRVALNVVQGHGMHHGARGPRYILRPG